MLERIRGTEARKYRLASYLQNSRDWSQRCVKTRKRDMIICAIPLVFFCNLLLLYMTENTLYNTEQKHCIVLSVN